MKEVNMFNKVLVSRLFFPVTLILCLLYGCGKSEEPGSDDRMGKEVRIRFELSHNNPDKCDMRIIYGCGYTGAGNAVEMEQTLLVSSPYTGELTSKKNLGAFNIIVEAIRKDGISTEIGETDITGKVFFDDKLIVSKHNLETLLIIILSDENGSYYSYEEPFTYKK
jgi:hypothetical protein